MTMPPNFEKKVVSLLSKSLLVIQMVVVSILRNFALTSDHKIYANACFGCALIITRCCIAKPFHCSLWCRSQYLQIGHVFKKSDINAERNGRLEFTLYNVKRGLFIQTVQFELEIARNFTRKQLRGTCIKHLTKNYMTSNGVVSNNVLQYHQLSSASYQVSFYVMNFWSCYQRYLP